VLGLLIITTLGILFHVNKSQYPPTLAAEALFMQLGLWPVPRPVMVTIPAGEFEMGDLSGAGQTDERPAHTVRFAKKFEMSIYEVKFDEYDLFAAATGRDKPSDRGWGRGERPVINVSWKDATAYAQWLSKRTGLNYRLPSEAEWEYAARATTKTPRYWTEKSEGKKEAACTHANVFDAKNESRLKAIYNISWEPFNCADEFPFTAPVGQICSQ
jgi:formylglycine-generating enzyme required for sulfatase activity